MKLKKISQSTHINTSADNLWSVLLQFGDVSQFHAGVNSSCKETGSENQASLGTERTCKVVDLGLKITLKERIVDFVEGKSYRYEVYEWKNFPIQKMYFAFTILESDDEGSQLELAIEYKAKPAVLTPLMAGKIRKMISEILLGYKHFAETGEKRVPIKQLKNRYTTQANSQMQYG